MTVLIDPPLVHRYGRRWSHLVSDESLAELHAFAEGVGLERRRFDHDHYDVPDDEYAQMLSAGAREVRPRDVVAALYAAGLRRR